MKNDQRFDPADFLSPDVDFAPMYIWVWNDLCTKALIDEQLSEMQQLGIRAFYILPEPKAFRPGSMPTDLSPDYLSAEYFDLCAWAVEQADALGMRCWLYDEGGWPSGGACGRVLRDHPEYARQTLRAAERAFSAGDVYQPSSPDVTAAFMQDKEMISDGFRFTADTAVTEYVIEQQIHGGADYPDLLNADATAYFLRVTHENYAAAMQPLLGKTVTAVFTDEPKAPAFSRVLAAQYAALYGESILPHLPLIAGRAKVTAQNAHILQRWYDLCSRMFCDHFLLPCKKWANEHGLAFTGHLDKDHDPLGCIHGGGNFNLMRALRCFDIPGVDVIWRQVYPENRTTARDDMNAYNGFYPRYAASAAAQNGTKYAMAEVFGVAGPGLTYDDMRFTVGYLAVRGVNIFNLFNFPLGRKDAYLAQELPVYTHSQPYWRRLSSFNRYMERLSYLSALGERVCETGLYYPVQVFQSGLHAKKAAEAFDTLGRMLEARMISFDIVDDDALELAGIEDGCLRIGSAAYRRILIPETVTLPKKTQAILNRFVRSGGSVSYGIPDLAPEIPVEGSGLRTMRRRTETGELLFLFRETGECAEYRIHLSESAGYLLNLADGTLQRFHTENGVLRLSLAVGETAVVLLSDQTFCASERKTYRTKYPVSGVFRLRRAQELTCGDNGFCTIDHREASKPVSTGDWAESFGAAYSGSGVYETVCSLPEAALGKEAVLDLGDVRFTAEVSLNGVPLGTVAAPPYRFPVPDGILQKENTLRITVTNTSANWYVHTDYFDRWEPKALSPYFEAEEAYAKDSAAGGLYGPVCIYTV